MNNNFFQTNPYVSPHIEVVVVEVEQGIAASIEDPGKYPEQDW
jgi:hypothetical protein